MLELRHLQVLRAIAREGSLAGAARSLGHSRPTIAHHLATLEAHFRTPLVERGQRGTELTGAGAALLPHAEAVLDRVRLAEDDVRAAVRHGADTLRVGCFPTAGAQLLPQAVGALARAGLRVSLVEGEPPALLARLRAGEVHAAVVFTQPDEGGDLAGEEFAWYPLLRDPLLLVLPADHPQARQDRVPLDALRDDPWIMGAADGDPCDQILRRACAEHGFAPRPGMRTDDYGLLQGLVAAGLGVALVPRLGLLRPRPDVAVRTLAAPPVSRHISLAAPRAADHASALRVARLTAALRTAVADLSEP